MGNQRSFALAARRLVLRDARAYTVTGAWDIGLETIRAQRPEPQEDEMLLHDTSDPLLHESFAAALGLAAIALVL